MIIDVLSNLENYSSLNKDFSLVCEFLNKNNLKDMKCGKYELRGKEVFLNLIEYETKPEQKLEAHKKYIDIQIVVTGEEYMGFCNIGNITIAEEYDEDRDVMFLNGKTDKIKADNKSFVIFYPQDAHSPALSIEKSIPVKKAIFKILVVS